MKKKLPPEVIYDAALKVFARYGFRRARMEDIAAELGLATGTLYNYAPHKKGLYEEAVAHGIRRWQRQVVQAVAKQENPADQFRVMCLKGYEYLAGDRDLRAIMIHDPSVFPLTPRRERFPEIDRASLGLIKDILARGVAQGVFAPLEVETTAEILYSIYVMFIIKRYVKSEKRSTGRMYRQGVELFLNGLLAR